MTEQGQTARRVYLPAGTDWYDWWTDKRYTGGQWIEAAAPIDHIPLFVRAGSIVPMGVQVPSTATAQSTESIRVYPGRDADFTLYDDDGTTNAYRKAGGRSAAALERRHPSVDRRRSPADRPDTRPARPDHRPVTGPRTGPRLGKAALNAAAQPSIFDKAMNDPGTG